MATIECVCPPIVKRLRDGDSTGDDYTTVRHPNGDKVTLRPKLNFRQGLMARNTVVLIKQDDPEASAADILAGLTEVYLLVGIESWTIQDARGKPVEVGRSAIRQLMDEHPEEAMTIGDEADALYSEAVIAPLVARASKYSPPTPISGSTSATNGSVPERRKRSKPSLTTTSQTDDIMPMSASQGGDFS